MDSGTEDSDAHSHGSSPSHAAVDSDTEAPPAATTRDLLEQDFAVSGSDSDSSASGSAHSGSAKRSPVGSASPKSNHSVASSRSSRRAKSGSRSRSSSAGSHQGSAKLSRSQSTSPKSNRSGGSGRSSPRSRSSSGSRSPAAQGSNRGSPRSRTGSPKSVRSGSAGSKRSSAGSDSDSRGSPRSAKGSRSRSGSPKSHHSEESDGGERIPERSPARFDPTDSESEGSKPSPKPQDEDRGRDADAQDKENEGDDAEVKMEEEDEVLPETRIDVEIPKITTDLGKSMHFVKLPNFLSVETRPFDPSTYEDEIDDEETLDEEGRARLKLKVENTIRWREKFDEKGVFVKESNARFVRWSDGSMSLHLGDEIFNVERQAVLGDHNHLFIRQGTGLQGQAVFRTKLTFRPHSTESFTHRKMTMSLADRSTKAQGIKVLSIVGADPEAQRDVLIKKEEDKLRASVRRENKQRRVRERGTKGLSTSYLDDEYSEEDNSISLAAIKNRYKKGGARAHIYSTDEDDGSDLEQGRKLEKAKRLKDSDDDDDDGEKQSGSPTPGQESPVAGPSSTVPATAGGDTD